MSKRRTTFTIAKLSIISFAAVGAFLGAVDPAAAVEGIGGVAERVNDQASEFFPLIGTIVQMLGLVLGIVAIMAFKKYNDDPRQFPLKNVLGAGLAAILLIAMPSVMGVGIGTFFEDGTMAGNQNDETFGIRRQ